MLGSTMFNFMALKTLRLDQTLTIGFLAPFIVALLAGPFLGEWIRWRRMLAIIVGFCGILVVIRPGYAAFEVGMIFAGISMACYAIFMLLTRYLSRFDPPEVTIFYSMLAGVFVMAPFAIAEWIWPADAFTWAMLISTGLWGGLGHYVFILAYRHAPASTLAPFIYFGLITHTTLGYLVFGQLPDVWTVSGAMIVIASGVYLVHREHVTAMERRKAERDALTLSELRHSSPSPRHFNGEKVGMRGGSIARTFAYAAAPHPNPLPARGERGFASAPWSLRPRPQIGARGSPGASPPSVPGRTSC